MLGPGCLIARSSDPQRVLVHFDVMQLEIRYGVRKSSPAEWAPILWSTVTSHAVLCYFLSILCYTAMFCIIIWRRFHVLQDCNFVQYHGFNIALYYAIFCSIPSYCGVLQMCTPVFYPMMFYVVCPAA